MMNTECNCEKLIDSKKKKKKRLVWHSVPEAEISKVTAQLCFAELQTVHFIQDKV